MTREYRIGNVIVRVHDGQMTKEERQQAAVNAIKKTAPGAGTPKAEND